MEHQLRCDNKMHGVIVEDGVLEIKCDSRFCGAGPGIIVLHRFDTTTGELLGTNRFKNPRGRVEVDGTQHDSAPVRPA